MKRAVAIIIFAIVVVNLVGFTVFLKGNDAPTTNNINQTNVNASSNNTNINNAKTVSLSELKTHDTKTNCWIAYKGKVYDISLWLPKHPGSSGAIEPYCGTANEFEKAFSSQHGTSQANRLFKEGIYKGDLK